MFIERFFFRPRRVGRQSVSLLEIVALKKHSNLGTVPPGFTGNTNDVYRTG